MSRMHSNALRCRFELERLKSRQWPLLGTRARQKKIRKNSKNNVKSHFLRICNHGGLPAPLKILMSLIFTGVVFVT